MRVRIKFSKEEPLQYLGHLDVMRFFQKAVRRAGLPAKYSGGFSPHIIMSFASPLGVGKTSRGEYFDLDLTEDIEASEVKTRLGSQMPEGIGVIDAVRIPEDKKANGMRSIAAAGYEIRLPEPVIEKLAGSIPGYLEQKQINVVRQTKKKTEETDIRPWIFDLTTDGVKLLAVLSAGSVDNLRPELLLNSLARYSGTDMPEHGTHICRTELYARRESGEKSVFVPLLVCEETEDEL